MSWLLKELQWLELALNLAIFCYLDGYSDVERKRLMKGVVSFMTLSLWLRSSSATRIMARNPARQTYQHICRRMIGSRARQLLKGRGRWTPRCALGDQLGNDLGVHITFIHLFSRRCPLVKRLNVPYCINLQTHSSSERSTERSNGANVYIIIEYNRKFLFIIVVLDVLSAEKGDRKIILLLFNKGADASCVDKVKIDS
jgi:hypothetical protein